MSLSAFEFGFPTNRLYTHYDQKNNQCLVYALKTEWSRMGEHAREVVAFVGEGEKAGTWEVNIWKLRSEGDGYWQIIGTTPDPHEACMLMCNAVMLGEADFTFLEDDDADSERTE